jgi:colanic acid/amylovoran biosynthesis glycosyltransferase
MSDTGSWRTIDAEPLHSCQKHDVKVSFATYDAPQDVGGVSVWMQRLLPLLQMAGFEVDVHMMAFGGKPGVNCTFFKEHGIPVRWIPWQRHLPYAVRSFLEFLEESQPDVYVPNCIVPAYFAAGYARRCGIPTVGVLHSDDPFHWGLADEFIKGRPEFRLSAIVPVSCFLESEVVATAEALGVTVCRIGCGVPIPAKSAELPTSVFRLVYIGRLVEEQKRVSDVASALCAAAQRTPNLEGWIVGEGSARNAVEDIIRTKGNGRVRCLGRVDNANMYDVLAQCHGLVLLSDYEGLPVSMLEAMAAGVVPICLDVRSGIREALEQGVNGLIVKDRADDFLSAVKALQGNSTKWRKLSLAARETVRHRYSIEECARQWVRLLRRLNSARAAAASFNAPKVLRLPPRNPKFGHQDMRLPWKTRLEDYARSVPAIHRMAKAALAVWR